MGIFPMKKWIAFLFFAAGAAWGFGLFDSVLAR